MKIIDEFKEFAAKGNVIDMAVGVIIGGAFGKIVSSLLNDIMMPPLGLLTGGVNFNDQKFVIKTIPGLDKGVTINYGSFITTVIDFAIVAFAVFMLIKGINSLKRSQPAAAAVPTEKQCPECLMNIPINAKRCGHCTQPLSA
ncbi:MAG: large-conductance mechanosensitive channel protein MscL [Elusimicrobia bacterium]|nr:large-conductance mechanosensitive channel protein MscL [Elusimicrobiota bacterium]